ncbi:MAG TPA: xanthine dehydrogenase family protein subunit M [Vicinamibacteria bacterium]|nr:xanthine dehydrogenase family protein subunit M [Vicinamibacteria bacterium]
MRGDALAARLLRPRSAAEACRLLARTPGAIALAGGTDAMVAWNAGGLAGRTFVDLSRLRPWTRIRANRAELTIGALATHAAIIDDPFVRRRLPLLAAACATVGGVQIQNRGTLGGNIANASPAGDTFPPLAVYEAAVVATNGTARREIPFLDVFAGVKRTTLAPGELIEAVRVKAPRRPGRQMFRKVGTRAAQAISKAVAAGLLWLRRDGTVEELRFALGSVAPTVRRLRAAEAYVRGRRLTPEVVGEAARLVAEDVSPIDDVRSTAAYRLAVSRNLLSSFLSARP